MKEKLTGLLKNKKVIGIAIAVVVIILVIVILANVFSAKPKKYEEKVKTMTKALTSESKMKDAIEDKIIDVKAAAAWKEADQEAEDFKKEYKKLKKDSDEVEDMEEALKNMAEEQDDYTYKVKNIKEPRKDKDNSKIYTVTATMVWTSSYYGTETENQVKFVFYKGKIIDIIDKETDASCFENAVEEYL